MSASSQTSASYPIDIIVPWVDGNDPVWQAQRAAYQQGSTNAPASDATAAYRFRDWDLMRYWFRAIDAFAPWVRRVFFVTCGQTPQWLDTSNPRLVCVDHRDYIPEEYLPTFDSNVIELFYNRIPDLAEHFVLFNDDMFLVAPTLANDFFKDGLPKDDAILGIIYTADSYDVFEHTMLSNSAVINRHFSLPEPESAYNIVMKYTYDKYPANPNGSDYNVAAIASPDGRHVAMMPHPERAFLPWQCAYYPAARQDDEITPWVEAFVNARKWVEKHKQN